MPGTDQSATISRASAFLYWLKLGFISFGGPAGQISMMHTELVEKRRWISEHRFLHALNYTMVLPGPEAQQLATYIGWLMHGTWGGIVAGSLFVLPSLVLLIGLSWVYLTYGDVQWVAGVLYGIKPAVTAIVLYAAWRIGSRALRNHLLRAIALSAFVAIFVFRVPFPLIVIGAALTGIAAAPRWPELFSSAPGHDSGLSPAAQTPALIDDHTPPPAHARFRWSRALTYAFIGLLLWLLAIAALTAIHGWDGLLTQMGWFFTKTALLTFGGAYAVLPYVYQGAVEHYQWLSATQMIDGLALGETTPGPLIMVVAFVGFVGGWLHQVPGLEATASGAVAAAVVTFFTFLPSFLFILVGAPAVEASRHEVRLTAPLAAITAAVVGVIVNLALFFALHVFWPEALAGRFDFYAALVGSIAFVALYRQWLGVVPVIAACGLAGLLYSLLT